VHDALDVADLVARVTALPLEAPLVVASRARSRAEFLRRPDLGREPDEPIDRSSEGIELAVVLADGLSARAVSTHAVPLLAQLLDELSQQIGGVAIATNARVARGDHIGYALQARAVVVLIGERPGLSVNDSLGAYLTYAPRPGRTDAERNCVSNIHSPHGLGYADAARVIGGLLTASFQLGESGVRVKDRSRARLDPSDAAVLDP
jgi:ethanolamine ammonia-lyase small subunit